MRLIIVITPMSIAPGISIMSRIWSLVLRRWMLVYLWYPLLMDLCPWPGNMCCSAGKSESPTFWSISTRWISSKRLRWSRWSRINSGICLRSMIMIPTNLHSLEVQPLLTSTTLILSWERNPSKPYWRQWIKKSKFLIVPKISHSLWLLKVPTISKVVVRLHAEQSSKEPLTSMIKLNSSVITKC